MSLQVFNGRRIIAELAPGRSFLAEDDSARHGRVVLKRLEDDCLLAGNLHPSIRQRLERVAQLPAKHFANLHGVEREGDDVLLVWEYIPGETLSQAIHSGRSLESFARELLLAVRALHAAGIVHGAIHDQNLIIDDRANLWITHASPLLFSDESVDAKAIAELLKSLRHPALDDVDPQSISMRELEQLLLAPEDPACEIEDEEEGRSQRMRSLVYAALAILAGIVIALWVRLSVT